MQIEELVRQGTRHAYLREHDEAIKCYQSALKINPHYSPALWSNCLINLLKGNYKDWADYSWLSDPKSTHPLLGWFKRRVHKPLWDGKSSGKVFVYMDNGYGDFIQFIRYLKYVKNAVVECPPDMTQLFQQYELTEPGKTPDCDFHCPMMLLPKYFGVLEGQIPADIPYIFAKETELSQLVIPGNINIGVVWQGNPKHKDDYLRSIPPHLFNLKSEGIVFYSLQKGEFHPSLINLGLMLNDWSDTASVIQKLDLVISVDTSVAHLAGAMGKPVWMLISDRPDWRWRIDGDSTPWYPSMRLFRQTTTWEELMPIISKEIDKYKHEVHNI